MTPDEPASHETQPAGTPASGISAPDALVLVLSNVPDETVADGMARILVDERLAACVNILGRCRSVYRWDGAVERAEEVTLLVKTTRRRHADCTRRMAALHPYDVPEIVTLSTDAVWPAYARWVCEETIQASPDRS